MSDGSGRFDDIRSMILEEEEVEEETVEEKAEEPQPVASCLRPANRSFPQRYFSGIDLSGEISSEEQRLLRRLEHKIEKM